MLVHSEDVFECVRLQGKHFIAFRDKTGSARAPVQDTAPWEMSMEIEINALINLGLV
jgi:hypothetical protein